MPLQFVARGPLVLPAVVGGNLLLDPGVLSVTPLVAYSSRKLRTAYSGNAMQVIRDTGGTQNIGFTGNDLDTGSLHSFIGANSGGINIWYDQIASYNTNVTADYAHSLKVIVSGIDKTIGGKIAAFKDGVANSVSGNEVPTITAQPYPFTICTLFQLNGTLPLNYTFYDEIINRVNAGAGEFIAQQRLLAGNGATIASTLGIPPDNNQHGQIFVYDHSAGALYYDGTSVGTTTDSGTHDFIGGQWLGGGTLFGNSTDEFVAEWIVFPGILGSTDRTTITTDWHNYWGTP